MVRFIQKQHHWVQLQSVRGGSLHSSLIKASDHLNLRNSPSFFFFFLSFGRSGRGRRIREDTKGTPWQGSYFVVLH